MIGSGDRSSADLARHGDPLHRKVAGMIRRVVMEFSFTGIASNPKTGIWQLRGFRELREVLQTEVFQGIGIWARPPKQPKTPHVEAIVVSIGDSDHQVVIALRDEKTRQAIAALVAEDETLLHNTLAGVHVQADGTIHVKAHGGAAARLPTWADFNALRDWIVSHVHTGVTTGAGLSGAPSFVGPASPVPTPTGTTVLKAE